MTDDARSASLQVKDDTELLELMNADMKSASRFYNPTNYWSYYEKFFLPEMREKGLRDFRRRHGSVLRSFGATDLIEDPLFDARKSKLLNNRLFRALPGWSSVLGTFSKLGSWTIARFPEWKKSMRCRSVANAKTYGRLHHAPPPDKLKISLLGNPEDVFTCSGNEYTQSMLYYYLRFAYNCKFIDYSKALTVVELGSGSGKNAEILKKYFPHLTILLFDISPQLYVCEQYLKGVFPGQVEGYQSTKGKTHLTNLTPGKIYIFGAWQFPLLRSFKYDLFINCASFQEMEPDVVENYLSIINGSAGAVSIMAKMDGKLKAGSEGEKGVLDPVMFRHYADGLSNFKCINREKSYYPNGTSMWDGYEDSFWEHRH